MTRSERDAFFERLVALRRGYGARLDDRRVVLSIEDAILYAEAVMMAVAVDDEEAWPVDASAAHDAGPAPAGRPAVRPARAPNDPWPWASRWFGGPEPHRDVDPG
jgi:hypothetical protein